MDHQIGENPLVGGGAEEWFQVITAVGPPSIIVVISSWLSGKAPWAAEDVWQETLLRAWSDRESFEWRGVRAFRKWLLSIAGNLVLNLAERQIAQKRGGGAVVVAPIDGEAYAGPVSTTTPSQIARDREAAELFQAVLASLPEELAEVVRLRLFEDLSLEEVAEATGLGVSGVRHRMRKGMAIYRQRLTTVLQENEEARKRDGMG